MITGTNPKGNSKYVTSMRSEQNIGLPGDVINHEGPGGSSVVAACDGAESLLPCSVPNLKLHLLPTHFNYPCAKLNANCMRTVSHNYNEKVEYARLNKNTLFKMTKGL